MRFNRPWYTQLTAGQAEIFGTTLITGQALTLRGHKVAVSAQPKDCCFVLPG